MLGAIWCALQALGVVAVALLSVVVIIAACGEPGSGYDVRNL